MNAWPSVLGIALGVSIAATGRAQSLAVPDAFPARVEVILSIPELTSLEEPLRGTRLPSDTAEVLTAWSRLNTEHPNLALFGAAHYARAAATRLAEPAGGPASVAPILGVDLYCVSNEGENLDTVLVVKMASSEGAAALHELVMKGTESASHSTVWNSEEVQVAKGDPVTIRLMGSTALAVSGPLFWSGTSVEALRSSVAGGGGRRLVEHEALRATWPLASERGADAIFFATPRGATTLGIADAEWLEAHGIELAGVVATVDVRGDRIDIETLTGFQRVTNEAREALKPGHRKGHAHMLHPDAIVGFAGDALQPRVREMMYRTGPFWKLAAIAKSEDDTSTEQLSGEELEKAFGPALSFNLLRTGRDDRGKAEHQWAVASQIRDSQVAASVGERLEQVAKELADKPIVDIPPEGGWEELDRQFAEIEVGGSKARTIDGWVFAISGEGRLLHGKHASTEIWSSGRTGYAEVLKMIDGRLSSSPDSPDWSGTGPRDFGCEIIGRIDLVGLAEWTEPIRELVGMPPDYVDATTPAPRLVLAVDRAMRTLGTVRWSTRLNESGRWTRMTLEFRAAQ